MRLSAHANASEIASNYLPLLRHKLCAGMLRDGAEGIASAIELMEAYLLSKDEFDTICSELRFPDIKVRVRAADLYLIR